MPHPTSLAQRPLFHTADQSAGGYISAFEVASLDVQIADAVRHSIKEATVHLGLASPRPLRTVLYYTGNGRGKSEMQCY